MRCWKQRGRADKLASDDEYSKIVKRVILRNQEIGSKRFTYLTEEEVNVLNPGINRCYDFDLAIIRAPLEDEVQDGD